MLIAALSQHFELLLLAYWGLACFASTVALLPLPGTASFRAAVQLAACRGKLMGAKLPHALGPLSDWTVPQRWFAHFYALGAVWNAALAYLLLGSHYYGLLPRQQQATCALALGLLQLHLTRRLLETVGLMRYPAGARMHGIAYIFGLSYYLLVSLSVLPAAAYAPLLTHAAGLLHASGSGLPPMQLPSPGWVVEQLAPVQLAGAAVFLAGNVLQWHSHWLLSRLAGRAKRTTYMIPRGGAFELVSSPHYLGEVVIYGGLVLAVAGQRSTTWLMLLWVVTNLSLAAGMTHRWYQQHFKTYPKSRRALFPRLY
ncbi:hypothetical protein D9Q98_001923 [Chlorella vulgaris]|uniref:3-oxo-5-alpha-steroid 4-dehydrogenase C-terminal domain-containing protein n=1 Tax=Chlorella vulgaris TaxID=3077 RepID=A0A9D4TV85_CHLVU|nr:hypothetical protein D9Q98_001923 [Chlorella vulgaris]